MECKYILSKLFYVHDFLECFAEFGIKYCVDNRIHKAVHIAEPSGQYECGDARLTLQTEFRANGIHNIAREKRQPAD